MNEFRLDTRRATIQAYPGHGTSCFGVHHSAVVGVENLIGVLLNTRGKTRNEDVRIVDPRAYGPKIYLGDYFSGSGRKGMHMHSLAITWGVNRSTL